MKKYEQYLPLSVLVILVLTACVPISSVLGITNPGPASTPQPIQTQLAFQKAQVQSIEIQEDFQQ